MTDPDDTRRADLYAKTLQGELEAVVANLADIGEGLIKLVRPFADQLGRLLARYIYRGEN